MLIGPARAEPAPAEQLVNLLTGSDWLAYDVALPAKSAPDPSTVASDAAP